MQKNKIICVTICLLLLASISLTGCLDDDDGQDTPEGAFELYVEAMDSGDPEKAMRYMDLSVSDHEDIVELRDGFLEDAENDVGDPFELESWKILSVKYRADFDSDIEEDIDDFEEIYERYDLSAEDFCMLEVEFEITYGEDGEKVNETNYILMVRIDGKWYISMLPMFVMFDDDWNGEGATLLAGSLSVRTAGTTYNATENSRIQVAISLSSPRSASEDDISLTIVPPTGIGQPDDIAWILLLDDGRIVTGSRLTLTWADGGNVRGTEIIIRIEGYDGTISTIAN